jgi:hypothetical protein
MAKPYIQNVPVPYMDLQTLWNDRRDPHASPLASSPRRSEARAGVGGLHHLVNEIYDRSWQGRKDPDDPTQR